MEKLFYSACKEGKLSDVKELVESGVNFQTGQNYGIQLASEYGHLGIVKYLVSIGANIHVQQNCAVRWACRNGHLETVKYLVSLGADIREFNDYAVRWACRNGHLETVKYLVSIGANVKADNGVVMCWTMMNNHLEVAKYLLKQGIDINSSAGYSASYFARTPEMREFFYLNGGSLEGLTPKEIFEIKYRIKIRKAYSRWRRVYLRNWIRRVLIPLYFSPQNQGGIQAKKELTNFTLELRSS